MKKAINAILGIIMLLGFVLVPASSVSAMSLSLTVCMQVQNLEAVSSDISMIFYSQTPGEAPIEVPATIPGNSSITLCNIGQLPAGFNGSAVISSATRLAAIANLQNPDFSGLMAAYHGFEAGSTTASVPLVKKDDWGYSTQFTVQNVGSVTTSVTANYTDGTQATKSIEAGRSVTFDQSTEAHTDPFPATRAGWIGAATLTSTVEPIVVVNLELDGKVLLANNGFATSDASTNPIFPMIQANWYTYFTGVAIQNTHATTDTTVTVAFTPTITGTACTQTIAIPHGAMVPFSVNAWDANDANPNNNCVNGQQFVGYAKVLVNTNNVPLVGITNELSTKAFKGGSYDGFNPAAGTPTVIFPLITDRNYGFFTGFSIVNVGTGPVDITCTYTPYNGVTPNKTQSTTGLLANGAWTVEQLNFFTTQFPVRYVGSGVCVATGTNPKIVGVLNYLKSGTATDTFLVSEGINQ